MSLSAHGAGFQMQAPTGACDLVTASESLHDIRARCLSCFLPAARLRREHNERALARELFIGVRCRSAGLAYDGW